MREITEIFIHCSATPPSRDIGRKEIDIGHRQRGWLMIGYHYVIRRDGSVETGRPREMAGAHARGHNRNSIAICMVGGVNELIQPESNFSDEQWVSLHCLVSALKKQYPDAPVRGHNEVSSKACPSFDVQQWLREHPLLDLEE